MLADAFPYSFQNCTGVEVILGFLADYGIHALILTALICCCGQTQPSRLHCFPYCTGGFLMLTPTWLCFLPPLGWNNILRNRAHRKSTLSLLWALKIGSAVRWMEPWLLGNWSIEKVSLLLPVKAFLTLAAF